MHHDLPFRPFPILQHSHIQTVLGSFLNLGAAPPSITEYIGMQDGDRIAVEISTPQGWSSNGGTTAILIPGLCGSHVSSNVSSL